jgi:hypothetical protein
MSYATMQDHVTIDFIFYLLPTYWSRELIPLQSLLYLLFITTIVCVYFTPVLRFAVFLPLIQTKAAINDHFHYIIKQNFKNFHTIMKLENSTLLCLMELLHGLLDDPVFLADITKIRYNTHKWLYQNRYWSQEQRR